MPIPSPQVGPPEMDNVQDVASFFTTLNRNEIKYMHAHVWLHAPVHQQTHTNAVTPAQL